MITPTLRRGRVGLVAGLAISLLGSTLIDPYHAAAADDVRKINWREDLAQAQAEAKSRDLLLWIQFTGSWCINCRRMDRATFLHPGVITESRERFIPIKLRSDEHESLAQTLGLTTLPATVIVRPNGEVVDRFEGYIEPERFEATLTSVLHREGRSVEQLAAKAAKKKPVGQDDSIALAGYCPVSLIREKKLVPGRTDLTVEHEGKTFRFADEATRVAFRQKPETFAPANEGRSPVSQVDQGDFQAGDPRWGVVYAGHLFLFKNLTERDRFVKDPERYANVEAPDRSSCPHCWKRSQVASKPPSRFSASFPGQMIPPALASRLETLLGSSPVVRR